MKKMLNLLISLIVLFTALSAAVADGVDWHCQVCNEDRNSEWCPVCGARRPTPDATFWTCPTCGRVLPMDYNFCPDDRTERSISPATWPIKTLSGTGTSLRELKDESMRHQSFFGPGKRYPGAGAYKPYKVTRATALFREGDYVLVDMSYKTVGRRCVFFKASSLTNASAEEMSLKAYPASVTRTVEAKYGPGNEYDTVVKDTRNPDTGSANRQYIRLSSGEKINVFFQTGNWVYAEFNCALGLIRAWLPTDSVM